MKMIKKFIQIATVLTLSTPPAYAAISQIESIGNVFNDTNTTLAVYVWLANTVTCQGDPFGGSSDKVRIRLGSDYSEPGGDPVPRNIAFTNYTALVNAAHKGLDVELTNNDLQWVENECRYFPGENDIVRVYFQ